ncbi:inhibin alpha chain [Pseudophryne corroboree]|uniref:inhibin alpha chain n=1 Tax=Pseudophryne corroboree TaxID=495146 RepID=UPI0030814E4B
MKSKDCASYRPLITMGYTHLLCTSYLRMSSTSLVLLMFLAMSCHKMGHSCEMPEGDRQIILDKVKARIVEALGPPPSTAPSSTPSPYPMGYIKSEQRSLRKRHSHNGPGLEDTSEVILFPSSDVLCETPTLDASRNEADNSFTYIFRPSSHILSRRVSSVQFWFFTGESPVDNSTWPQTMPIEGLSVSSKALSDQSLSDEQQLSPNVSSTIDDKESDGSVSPVNSTNKEGSLQTLMDIQVLSEQKPVTVATSKVQKMDDWSVFHLAPAFLNYVTRSLFVLLVHCPTCPCSDQPENTPFLMYSTRPSQRGRRSGIPWSPSALELLQRPPSLGADSAECHRGSLNISFEELGWNQWIVHPGTFQFHYCHGTCSPSHGLSTALHWGHCCAAQPSTMKPLRVTTTTDGGFSFRYETVPNLLTQDCACS